MNKKAIDSLLEAKRQIYDTIPNLSEKTKQRAKELCLR